MNLDDYIVENLESTMCLLDDLQKSGEITLKGCLRVMRCLMDFETEGLEEEALVFQMINNFDVNQVLTN
ncbi:hypothetical protein [Eubacterium limosum]|uniref:hypothetical protein n=1 Tax=Eubacterium limosum TaxID=1736 RepID=UPI0010625578|nr:hypothetical protein [Eubacterium limosum]